MIIATNLVEAFLKCPLARHLPSALLHGANLHMDHIRVRLLRPLQPKDPGPVRRHSQWQIPHNRSRRKTQTRKQLVRRSERRDRAARDRRRHQRPCIDEENLFAIPAPHRQPDRRRDLATWTRAGKGLNIKAAAALESRSSYKRQWPSGERRVPLTRASFLMTTLGLSSSTVPTIGNVTKSLSTASRAA